jgi:hypothetical protein
MAASERRHELHIRLDAATFGALQGVARHHGRPTSGLLELCIGGRLTSVAKIVCVPGRTRGAQTVRDEPYCGDTSRHPERPLDA